ncbi:MAG TPA: potassium channel family protein [Candidatus Polarisedimenticolia bacterium]|nr:potassium channel family protein [Candidatus Polarisedimenticolia bacterium]
MSLRRPKMRPAISNDRRFIVALVGVSAFLALQPVLSQARREGGLQAGLVGVLFPLFGIWVARDSRLHLIISSILSLLSVLGNVRHIGLPRIGSETFGTATALLFTGYTTVIILASVLRSQRITLNVIAGAVAGYLMLGVTWAMVHLLIDQCTASAYSVTLLDAAGLPNFPTAVYYSFTTLLTIGFGDITPTGSWARAMTVMEGVTGFIYGTVVVAWLVANHVTQITAHKSGGE